MGFFKIEHEDEAWVCCCAGEGSREGALAPSMLASMVGHIREGVRLQVWWLRRDLKPGASTIPVARVCLDLGGHPLDRGLCFGPGAVAVDEIDGALIVGVDVKGHGS